MPSNQSLSGTNASAAIDALMKRLELAKTETHPDIALHGSPVGGPNGGPNGGPLKEPEEPGYVYLLTNPDLAGFVKIGMTTTPPKQRLKGVTRDYQKRNLVSRPFQLRRYVKTPYPRALEKALHGLFAPWQMCQSFSGGGRELFRITVPEAYAALKRLHAHQTVTAQPIALPEMDSDCDAGGIPSTDLPLLPIGLSSDAEPERVVVPLRPDGASRADRHPAAQGQGQGQGTEAAAPFAGRMIRLRDALRVDFDRASDPHDCAQETVPTARVRVSHWRDFAVQRARERAAWICEKRREV